MEETTAQSETQKRVAELNRVIEDHFRVLCAQQWNETCKAADGQMHHGKTYNLLSHLHDETKTKCPQRERLAKHIYRASTANTSVVRRPTQREARSGHRRRGSPRGPARPQQPVGGRAREKTEASLICKCGATQNLLQTCYPTCYTKSA